MALDKYKFFEKIGVGGMAEVYRARIAGAEGFRRTVAVKRILPHLTGDPQFVSMLIEEAKILSSLNHPNIVQVHDFEKAGNEYLLIMEFVRGKSLAHLLARYSGSGQRLSAGLIAHVIAESAAALAHAYNMTDESGRPLKIVHRDISPQNIMITLDGLVKLTDFGIAKAADSESHTREGFLKGKMAYLPPEQAAGKQAGHRSDIFALGTVAFEMATGYKLFRRATDIETFHAVSDWSGLQEAGRPEHIPDRLWNLLMKMLEPNPDGRYQTASEIRRELNAYVVELSPESGETEMASLMMRVFGDEMTTPSKVPGDARSLEELINSELIRLEKDDTKPRQAEAGLEPPQKTLDIRKRDARPSWRRRRLAAVILFGLSVGAFAVWWFYPVDTAGCGSAIQLDAGRAIGLADGRTGAAGIVEDAGVEAGDRRAVSEPEQTRSADMDPDADTSRDRPAPRKRYGTLVLNSDPWAYVEIDGRKQKKPTPIAGLKLRPGRHTIRLYNPVVKKRKTIQIWIRAGKTTRKVVRF